MLLQHPAVIDVAVVPAPHRVKGQAPVAWVVPGAAEVSEDELKQWFLARGPAYAHPRRVFFIDRLPVGGTNKIDRKHLQEEAARLLPAGLGAVAEGTREQHAGGDRTRARRSREARVGELPRREPGADEVRVQVLACALNHLDIFVRRGMPGVSLPLPHVAGGDIVGRVEAAGGPAGESLIGQTVLLDPLVGRHALGESLWGGLAEFVVAPAANAILLGDDPGDLARYAALPIAYGTARRMLLLRAGLVAGETVAVLGATGGVGLAASRSRQRSERA